MWVAHQTRIQISGLLWLFFGSSDVFLRLHLILSSINDSFHPVCRLRIALPCSNQDREQIL